MTSEIQRASQLQSPSVRQQKEATLHNNQIVTPPHDTMISALESGAKNGDPYVTIHHTQNPVSLDFKRALEGAWQWSVTLRKNGITPGERVVLLLPTSATFVEAFLGTMMAGAIAVPLAAPMTFGGLSKYLNHLNIILKDADAHCLITYPRVSEALQAEPTLKQQLTCVLTETAPAGPVLHQRFLPSIDDKSIAFLQYTSGTTGQPKGVMVSHKALVSNAFAIATGLEIKPTDVGVSWLPLFHDMGLIGVLLTSLCHPYPIHLMAPERFVARPGGWLKLLSQVGGTLSAAPNFAYNLCCERPGELDGVNLEKWRCSLNGAEPVHAQTMSRFSEQFGPLGYADSAMTPVYGMAESTLAVTFSPWGSKVTTLAIDKESLERFGRVEIPSQTTRIAVSVGRPVAGTSVAIADASGHWLAEKQVGEIRVKGPSLMDGYFRKDDLNQETLTGGWLRTGDLGFIADGELFIVGRSKDVIIKGGRNYYPQDIEHVAGQVLGVQSDGVAVFGRTDGQQGTEEIVLVAESRERDENVREKLVKTIKGEILAVLGIGVDRIALWPVGAIPRTTSGKIQRKACASKWETMA